MSRLNRFVVHISTAAIVTLLGPTITQAAGQVTFGSSLSEYVTNFYKWSIGAGTALAIIFIIYAGYTMVTSAGDPAKVGFAKEIIVGTLSGLALLAAASLVFNLLSIGQN